MTSGAASGAWPSAVAKYRIYKSTGDNSPCRAVASSSHIAPAASLRSGKRLRPPLQSGRRQTVPPPRGTEDSRKSRRCCGRSGDLFLQFDAGLADLRRHQGTVLNLKEDALGLLAVARCGFLHLLGHGERIAGHRLALLHALDQLRAHRLDVFRRSFVFESKGSRKRSHTSQRPFGSLASPYKKPQKGGFS